MIETSIEMFFKTAETVEKITFSYLLDNYFHNVLIIIVVVLVLYPFKFFNFKSTKAVQPLDAPSVAKFSKFTHAIIIMFGLPLLGLMLSMIPVRVFEILNIPVDSKITVSTFVLVTWLYGIYKCRNIS
ncbi:hypothetical protein MDMS009_1798 [Methylophaga thiooxydans DMS010]|uniref:Uncharacterized protein n=1 Tax=Methylophaga thiooxydans DMS010 TaxID=637616 RepID=C0N733_9GAMM|nr:hypothetical protein MDMS009_1798 [Methylophaga thiooxydans DMS010]